MRECGVQQKAYTARRDLQPTHVVVCVTNGALLGRPQVDVLYLPASQAVAVPARDHRVIGSEQSFVAPSSLEARAARIRNEVGPRGRTLAKGSLFLRTERQRIASVQLCVVTREIPNKL